MALKFNTSTLKDTEYATYNLSKFNGADYTTTPTSVDDSRAIDLSNYLPEGDSLYKRPGWERIEYNFETNYEIANVFKFKDKYVFLGRSLITPAYCSFFIADNLEYTNGYRVLNAPFYEISQDFGGWAFEKDDMLFVFTGQKYVRLFFQTVTETVNDVTTTVTKCYASPVENNAYIPTIAIGVQKEDSSASSANTYEEFNMLANKAKIGIDINYSDGYFYQPVTTSIYNWEWKGTFDLTNYFANFDNLTLETVNGSTPLTVGDYKAVGLIDPNDGSKSKVAMLKLDGKKLFIWVNAATNVTYENNAYTIDYIDFTEAEKNRGMSGIKELTLQFSYTNTDGIQTINKMRFGAFFGANGYRDTLFVTGNTDYKNLDIHTCIPKDTTVEDWVTYTYFGDMSYHKIGSSSSAILGYGINSDSSMMIFKETVTGEPNVYVRTSSYKIEEKTISGITYNNAYTLYQVYPTSIKLDVDKFEQIIQYDNKVLVNAKDGVYYINVDDSTAESSYRGIELSYLIRNNLGTDLTNACYVEHKGKLYISRKDKTGNKRVYVCDKNRYTFKDSKITYEWWALDHIEADKFFNIDDELYFLTNGRLYKFTDTFYDLDKYTFTSISVGDDSSSFVTDLFFDYDNNEMIITGTNELIQKCKTSSNPKEAYEKFKNETSVMINHKIYWVLDDYLEDRQNGFYLKEEYIPNGNLILNTMIKLLAENEYKFYISGAEYQASSNWDYVYDNNELVGIVFNDELEATENTLSVTENATTIIPIAENTKFGISELNDGTHYLDNCIYQGQWIHIQDGVYDELGTNIVFNHFKLTYNGIEINFALDSNYISSAKLEFRSPISAYWLSGYTALGRLDYLKTTTNIYFVPDARKGGYTYVGYRTYKKDVGFFTNAKGDTFDFNDINFDDFSFSQAEFGRTYTSKKKIKNFSFIQLKFYSNDEANSTLVSYTFRYKYSKNNKGVK